MKNKRDRLQFVILMTVFGTIGTLSRYIDMPSSVISLGRAFAGVVAVLIILWIRKRPLDKEAIRRNIGWLMLTSTLMCANWICQFEAFKHTTIATATLCYYIQPVILMIGGIILFKERMTLRKGLCALAAFAGMVLVSGVLSTGIHLSEIKGVLFALAGGFFYAVVVLVNKYMKDISTVDTTVMQLALVTVLMIPYSAMTGAFGEIHFTTAGVICLLVLGVVHTGIAYIFYFDAINKLPTQVSGILSYIDPVVAVLLSAFFLKEPLTVTVIIGAVMILGSTAVNELSEE